MYIDTDDSDCDERKNEDWFSKDCDRIKESLDANAKVIDKSWICLFKHSWIFYFIK